MARSYEVRYAEAKRAQLDRLANSPEAVAWRLADNEVRAQVAAEQRERWPHGPATVEEAQEILAWLEVRLAEVRAVRHGGG